jgi:hypothetical protein
MTGEIIDPRLVFLARASARLVLVEAGEMDLDEAFDELIESVCDCRRRPLAAQWSKPTRPGNIGGAHD